METNNSFLMVPLSMWEGLRKDIAEIKRQLMEPNTLENKGEWLTSVEVREKLGVSAKTWQTYRDERRIPFSQLGRKIYVKKSDLEAFMEAHKIKSRDE